MPISTNSASATASAPEPLVSSPPSPPASPLSPLPRAAVSWDTGRKFRALCLAMVVYGLPVVMTFVLVLAKQATFADLKDMTKWMGLALSPAFLGYIGGVALEGYAEKRDVASPSNAIATTGSVVVTEASTTATASSLNTSSG